MTDLARQLLEALYAAAVDAAAPDACVRQALALDQRLGERPTWLLALGKGASAMTEAAIAALATRGAGPAGGIIVPPGEVALPHPSLVVSPGSHPLPDERSFAAASAIGAIVERVGEGDDVLVLVSGGATSLAAAPADGVSDSALVQCFQALLGSGADIVAMNAIRKRITRWGAGRLATALAARGARRVRCLIVSDVLGDDPASIGSGPCAPDALTADDVLARVERDGLEAFVPSQVREYLHAVVRGERPETPKPDDPRFERVVCDVVLGNRSARAGAARAARERGLDPVKVVEEPLDDDAAYTGERIVEELIRFREASLDDGASGACMVWGGETTVRLGTARSALGGRCQELVLSAAFALRESGERGRGITLLAAGTDGRDGPTDAAGGVVDAETWGAIRAAGRDPERDLVDHDSHRALDAVGALLRVGPTGTNVGDIVIGLVER